MSPGVVVLLVAVVATVAFGSYRALTDGRFRGTHRVRGVDAAAPAVVPASVLADTPWEAELGDRATLLQFSSAFCAPCRATRHVLSHVAATHPGVSHVEVDAEHHLDVVRRLGILRTPTTLVLGPDGREVTRAAGAPTRQQVLDTLAELARRSG
jgi:thiol-disulfide isomerase/thioredoxin